MSETAQGPWIVEEDTAHNQWIVRRPGSGVIFLSRRTRRLAEEACAHENALWRKRRMEAAAPDMMAELHRIVAEHEVAGRHTVTPENAFEAFGEANRRLCEIYDRARALIAKATGGDS